MNLETMATHAVLWSYRLAHYAMLNLVDDAALLALMFC
ncbi:MAG: hypothetical protein RL392_1255 [Pseudomonadota bacterium]|jgi:hypothetical protein